MLAFEQVLLTLWASFISALPGILSAIIILIIGFIVGKVLGKVVKEILLRLRVDHYVIEGEKQFKLSDIFSLITRWWIYLVFIQQSAVYLGIAAISEFVESIIGFIPGLVGAALVIIIGYIIAEYIKDKVIAKRSFYSSIVGKLVFFLLVYVSVALALPLVGIDSTIVNAILLVLIGSVGLGMAIALGLGLKDVIHTQAKEYIKRSSRKRKR